MGGIGAMILTKDAGILPAFLRAVCAAFVAARRDKIGEEIGEEIAEEIAERRGTSSSVGVMCGCFKMDGLTLMFVTVFFFLPSITQKE